MTTICGMDCCSACAQKDACGGCVQTGGHPFGGSCIAAECVEKGGREALLRFKAALIEEINALDIPGLAVSDMNLLTGAYVNLEYTLPSGATSSMTSLLPPYAASGIPPPTIFPNAARSGVTE